MRSLQTVVPDEGGAGSFEELKERSRFNGTASFILVALRKARVIEAQQAALEGKKKFSRCACDSELLPTVAFFPRWHSFAVECRWCGARGQSAATEQQAIANWDAGLLTGLSTQQKSGQTYPNGRWTPKVSKLAGRAEPVQHAGLGQACSAPGCLTKENA